MRALRYSYCGALAAVILQICFGVYAFAQKQTIQIVANTHTSSPTTQRDTSTVHDRSHDVTGLHQTSTITVTVRVPTSLDSARLILHRLRSALGSDSPDDRPDMQDELAATSNIDIAETIAASLIQETKFDNEDLKKIDRSNIIIGNQSRQNKLHLTSGNALFTPNRDITVLTEIGEIDIARGSTVFIMKSASGLVSVYDLHDTGNSKVVIRAGNNRLKLSPGMQITLCNSLDQFKQANLGYLIPHRKLQREVLSAGLNVYSGGFSIQCAIVRIQPLRNRLLSADKSNYKETNRLLKDFVILRDLSQGSPPFEIPNKVTPTKISQR